MSLSRRALLPRCAGAALLFFATAGCQAGPRGPIAEQIRYFRPTPHGVVRECSFTIENREDGRTITSVTGDLTVCARYDASDRLLEAEAKLSKGAASRVIVSAGRAKVLRPDRDAQDFDVPAGVIVTSAPDWTDAFWICRLWDRERAGRREFPGLWIHPVQPAQRLTFTAERVGGAALSIGGTTLPLDRLSIRLRGNSEYLAWVDSAGRMIKLAARPANQGSAVLILEGYETASAALVPD